MPDRRLLAKQSSLTGHCKQVLSTSYLISLWSSDPSQHMLTQLVDNLRSLDSCFHRDTARDCDVYVPHVWSSWFLTIEVVCWASSNGSMLSRSV